MKTVIHPASERGGADFGWLNARHSFSFGQWYDPAKSHFGALRVLNDDIIKGGGGFPAHAHENMEIVTIPLQGALAHKDSTGGEGAIRSGDIQIMSAGAGIKHSEFNASQTEKINLLQVWVFPKLENIKPRYDQKTFAMADRQNTWQVVVSPDESDALWINQDAQFALTNLEAGKEISYNVKFKGNGVYIFVIEGAITINNQELGKRDAAGVSDADGFSVHALEASQLLAIEVPMINE
ncbi:MAG: pirin family protein [Chitinophagaceae bacterium]|nr:pirin family protein [Chitinophagaceae bacterium]